MRSPYLLVLLLMACSEDPAVGDAGVDTAVIDAPTRDAGVLDATTPDAGALDAATFDGGTIDGGTVDGGTVDGGTVGDAGQDASADDAGPDAGESDAGVADSGADAGTRTNLLAGFCPSAPTAAGRYRGTLASNLNDIAGGCGVSGAGRDGALRIELAPGETLHARYRHAGDGVLYLLDSCPVVGSCLVGSDGSGEETLSWTHTGASVNPVYLVLDSDSLGGPQTFELDLSID